MEYLYHFYLSLLLLVGLTIAGPVVDAAAGAVVSSSPMSPDLSGLPYPLSAMSFAGNIGGYEISYNGTLQEVFAHAHSVYPEFDVNMTSAATDLDESVALHKRAWEKTYCCPVAGQDWFGVDYLYAAEQIYHLNHVHGSCGVAARSCARVSCSWNAAVYFCNDLDVEQQQNCHDLASYVVHLRESCDNLWHGHHIYCCGQAFDDAGYNVILKWDKC